MRLLVFQHLAIEHPGIFADFWREAGHEITTVELDEGDTIPELHGFDLLAVMGGPMDVWEEQLYPWLVPEKAAIRNWVMDLGRPYFGLCLGHQLLADALGGRVGPMARPEVGVTEVTLTEAGRKDPLLSGVPQAMATLQWHGAEVSALPPGGSILAANEACGIQAMKWGRWAYGFQYHLEIGESTVDDWAKIPAYRENLERELGPSGAVQLAAAVAGELANFRRVSRKINENLFALITEPAPV